MIALRSMQKMAEELSSVQHAQMHLGGPTHVQEEYSVPSHPVKTLAKGVLGLGAGIGAGWLATKGVDKLLKHYRGSGITKPELYYKLLPIAAGVTGLATPFLMNTMQDKMKKDHVERQYRERANT